MSHKVCKDIGNWVDQNVNQQLERCVEQDCNWWCLCCNKWFCFLVWVLVTITTWVVQTVCEVVADVVDVVIGFVTGFIDIVVGIATGDWSRVAGGFIEIFAPIGILILDAISIATLGTLVGAFSGNADRWSLRDHVRTLLEARFAGNNDLLMSIKDALGVDAGGFGLRLQAAALRSFVRSDFSSQAGGTPDLITFVNAGLDLKALAGFNPPPWWNRSWPELVGDSGAAITASDIDDYVAAGGMGKGIKHFTLFSMSKSDMQGLLDVATTHAIELGLILQWTIVDTRLAVAAEVVINAANFNTILTMPPFSRHNRAIDAAAAQAELCMPIGIGAFGFTDPTLNGFSADLAGSTCLEAMADGSTAFPADGITGVAFRYRKPEVMFKYAAVHELGHTFGLCHVNGLLRIMFTNAPAEMKSKWSWSSLYQYYTSGVEAGFVLDEAKSVWNYIVMNFAPSCLRHRPF